MMMFADIQVLRRRAVRQAARARYRQHSAQPKRARVGDNDGARHAAGGVGQLVVRSGGGGRHAGGVRREAACVVVEALHSPEVKDKYLSQGAIAVGNSSEGEVRDRAAGAG